MEKVNNIMQIYVDKFVFDTAECMGMVYVSSNFMYTDNSSWKWCDDSCYGSCHLDLGSLGVWKELAECIKNLEWKWKKSSSKDEATPIDGDIKTKLLYHMLNVRGELDEFILHTLQNNPKEKGIFPNAEGWIRIDKLWEKIRCEHTIFVSEKMIQELLETDEGWHYVVNEDRTLMKVKTV